MKRSLPSLSLVPRVCKLCGGCDSYKPPRVFTGNVIKALLGLSGSIALLMFVWGGMQWLISVGNPERIQIGT